MGLGRLLLCEREKRWKGLGEIVRTYLYSYLRKKRQGRSQGFLFLRLLRRLMNVVYAKLYCLQ